MEMVPHLIHSLPPMPDPPRHVSTARSTRSRPTARRSSARRQPRPPPASAFVCVCVRACVRAWLCTWLVLHSQVLCWCFRCIDAVAIVVVLVSPVLTTFSWDRSCWERLLAWLRELRASEAAALQGDFQMQTAAPLASRGLATSNRSVNLGFFGLQVRLCISSTGGGEPFHSLSFRNETCSSSKRLWLPVELGEYLLTICIYFKSR